MNKHSQENELPFQMIVLNPLEITGIANIFSKMETIKIKFTF